MSDDDVFIHWGGSCESLLRVAGAISASFVSEKYVTLFLCAVREGDRNVAGAAAPAAPSPFDVLWSREDATKPWPAVLIPREAARYLCSKSDLINCAAKKDAVIIYLGDPPMKSLTLDYPSISSLDGWKFGLNGPEDQRTAEIARGTMARIVDKKWDVSSFNIAYRSASWLRRGLSEVWGPAIAQQSFVGSATITAAFLKYGSGVDDGDTDTVAGDISDIDADARLETSAATGDWVGVIAARAILSTLSMWWPGCRSSWRRRRCRRWSQTNDGFQSTNPERRQ